MNTKQYKNEARPSRRAISRKVALQAKSKGYKAIQMMDLDEDMLQGKFSDPAQRMDLDEDMLQGKFASAVQRKASPLQLREEVQPENKTGMPNQLKSNLEQMSGMDMSDVRVHYNSSKPATVQAHAYTQGTDIHIGPSQEKHLAHESWHVAQQKAGRVKPTTEVNGMPVNDNSGLETEADNMAKMLM